ncbi:MAG: hypothetical protein WBG90_20670 [Saonia sp.]
MKYTLFIICTLFFISCHQKEDRMAKVTNKEDYNKFLVSAPPKTSSKYFEVWNSKIKSDSMQLTSFGVVARQYNNYFQSTGDIKFLKQAEQALEKAVEIAAIGKSGYYRALARNYISQHRFKEAFVWAEKARILGSDLQESQALLFDVHMELGNYTEAEEYLNSIKNMSDFGYLIRLAKWNDHKGNLDTTIKFMEIAKTKAESSKNKNLMLWSYTNLADYYGHAGNIKESYEHYLKSLELDPKNAYAKKGIAWIVFSHERNPKEALRILNAVTKNHTAPDHYLLKAEIADYMGDDIEKIRNQDRYYNAIQDRSYGDMYNTYNVALFLQQNNWDKAIELAKKEVENRPTPESYDLLAYSYFKKGEKRKALEIVERFIAGKTAEPLILYHTAEIYKAMGTREKVESLKQELLGAIYELGPAAEQQIVSL